jgi:hypothetical protein
MGRFVSNRNEIEDSIRQGNWVVAFSRRELTETDLLGLLIATGAAIYTDQPEIVIGFLSEVLDESIAGLEQSIAETMSAEVRSQVENFAVPRIKNLLFGRSSGEATETFGHFGIKAGVAQFVGHNEEWNPIANLGGFINGDTGEWQQVGPGLVSYCPYVGLRFLADVPPAHPPSHPPEVTFHVGPIEVVNDLGAAIDVRLYHPQNVNQVLANWHINAGLHTFLALNNQNINIGSDWRIQTRFVTGSFSAIYRVGAKAPFTGNAFVFNANSTPSLSVARILIQNNYNAAVDIRLYHPQNPGGIWNTWRISANLSAILAVNNQQVTIGSDWHIQVVFDNGVVSTRRPVAEIAFLDANMFQVAATRIENG